MSVDQTDGPVRRVPPPPEPAVEAALREVAAQAEAAVAACDGVAVTIARQGKPTGAVFSSEVVREVDSVQYEHEVGPCLDAIRQLQVFRVDFLPEARSWPEFSRTAQRRGMLSSLSVPLVAGGEVRGALNLYSRARNGFKGCEQAAIDLAIQAESALAPRGDRASTGDGPGSGPSNTGEEATS